MASSTLPVGTPNDEGSTPAHETLQNSLAEYSASAQVGNSSAGATEPQSPNVPPAGAAVGGSSPVEGLVAIGGAAANIKDGEVEVEVEVAVAEDPKPSAKTLDDAQAFFQKGCDALRANDLIEAVDSLAQALEIRVAHFGELASECATTYFKYGCALLYKSQDEADPLNESVALAKKAQVSSKNATEGLSEKAGEGESSDVPASEASEKVVGGDSSHAPTSEVSVPPTTNAKGKAPASEDNGKGSTNDENNDEEEDDKGEESEDEDAGEDVGEEADDEEDSDLDLAWKNLEAARVILDKQEDTIEKVDVISALGDVSLEREDFSTAASDYTRALSILEHMDEAESRHIAELCFKICLALQMQRNLPDALNYCQRALSICTSCMQTLMNEVEASNVGMASKDAQTINGCDGDQNNVLSTEAKEDEIKVLKGLMTDLSDKVEDLKQMMTEPPLIEIARNAAEDKFQFALTGRNSQEAIVSTGFDQPTLSNAPSNGTVTDLGVVGRGVKRVAPVALDASAPAPKRLSLERIPAEKTDSSAMEVSEAACLNCEAKTE